MNERLAVLLVTAVAQQTEAIAALGANIMGAIELLSHSAAEDGDPEGAKFAGLVGQVPYTSGDFEQLIKEASEVRNAAEQYRIGSGS